MDRRNVFSTCRESQDPLISFTSGIQGSIIEYDDNINVVEFHVFT
jgi:hypothetical protein